MRGPPSAEMQRLRDVFQQTLLEVLTVRFKYRTGIEQVQKVQTLRAGQLKAPGDQNDIVSKIIDGEPYKTQLIKYLKENEGKRETKLLN